MVATPPVSDIDWRVSYRIIRSIYPPIDLFEDIANPADWELIASLEEKTNPRVRNQIGDISLVPIERRISGPGAGYAMAPFTHVSRDRPSRFSDGSYGVWYCGDRFEVALNETVYHFAQFMRRTKEPPADAQFRELTCRVTGAFHDLRGAGFENCLLPDDWSVAQVTGAGLRKSGSNGIVYPSVRWPVGEAAALFWPDLISLPVIQARHLEYHWDGTTVTRYFVIGEDDWYVLPMS
jgi:hypothetical protein